MIFLLAGTAFLAAEGVTEEQLAAIEQESVYEASAVSEEDGILLMREEEKLARDVYLALYEKWNINVFNNIARAEQQHMDSMAYLMDQQGIADPVAYAAPGEFTIEKIDNLYTSLVEQGSESPVAALKVGALIEDLDIADLEELLAGTDDQLTIQVYQNLIAGSENHMRAFMNQLSMYGETYEPAYITSERMDGILYGSMGMGNAGSMGRGAPSNSRGGGHHGWN